MALVEVAIVCVAAVAVYQQQYCAGETVSLQLQTFAQQVWPPPKYQWNWSRCNSYGTSRHSGHWSLTHCPKTHLKCFLIVLFRVFFSISLVRVFWHKQCSVNIHFGTSFSLPAKMLCSTVGNFFVSCALDRVHCKCYLYSEMFTLRHFSYLWSIIAHRNSAAC